MKKTYHFAAVFAAMAAFLYGCDRPDGDFSMGGVLDLNFGDGGRSGTYLTGRHAQTRQELDVAQNAFDQVLARDPRNLEILRQAFQVSLTAGDLSETRGLANRIVALDDTASIPRMVLAMMALRDGDADAARTYLADMPKFGFNLFVAPLIEAWVEVEAGNIDAALAALDRLEEQSQMDGFAAHNRALILDFADREKEARDAFNRALGTSPNLLQLVRAKGHFLARMGDQQAALELYKAYVARAPGNRFLTGDLRALQEGTLPARLITETNVGAAAAVFDIARDIVRETRHGGASEIGLVFTRIALAADPGLAEAQLMIAGLYEDNDQMVDALAAYQGISEEEELAAAEHGIARTLFALDRKDEAFATLSRIVEEAKDDSRRRDAGLALGQLYRVDEQFDKAAEVYSRMIDDLDQPAAGDWNLYYARGTTYERMKDWPRAEQDLQQALVLRPDEPLILNYLGYSWIDRGEHLQKARRMVERAVSLRPHDGHIVDSLGWAYFKLGQYEDAVTVMERAVQLQPGDPVINDHLGDALWQVGRKLEARYQWRHVLTLDPEPDLEARLREKLDIGLHPGEAVAEQDGQVAL